MPDGGTKRIEKGIRRIMGLDNIVELLGGLGAFLFGMHYMGEGLSLAAGSKMKDLLEKLTRNPIFGFLIGMLVTVVIQSSSATTVMVMGFINAGIMDLAQATGVIFGANIGTTITSVLIALDVSGIAPFCIAAGALLLLYMKRKRMKYFGQVVLGFGLLFQGLHTMSSAMSPLKDSPVFQKFIMNADNPVVGFLIGVVICAILQSSSAAVGIIQALAMQGLMPLDFAAFLVCGINVGSSTPPLLSALNARHNAQRAAIIYLIFNVIGAIIFVPLTIMTPLTDIIEKMIPSAAFQVSLYHILFKVVTGLILLPLVNLVVKLTYKIIPVQAHESEFRLKYLDKKLIGAPSVMTLQMGKEVDRLGDIVIGNLRLSLRTLLGKENGKNKVISENEEVIDYLTGEITEYLTRATVEELPGNISEYLGCVYSAINDLEQIGDHALRILEESETNSDQKMSYSAEAEAELQEIAELDLELLGNALSCFSARKITLEQWSVLQKGAREVVRLSGQAQNNHMERLRDKKCTFEQGLTFVEVLNSLSRIVNHVSNIAETVLGAELRAGLPEKSGAAGA